MKKFWIVFKKELIDTLRDRRTLLVMVLIPLIVFPLIFKIVTAITTSHVKKTMEKKLVVAYIESRPASGLFDLVREESLFDVQTGLNEEQIKNGIETGELDFGLVVSSGFVAEIEANRPGPLKLYFKGSEEGELAKKRIDKVLDKFEDQVLSERFSRLNMDRSIASGLDITIQDVASMQEKIGEKIGGFVPYLFIIFCFLGSMYPAIDLAAGEKERGTIETLLVTPVSRMTIVFGKFAVVFVAGMASVILGLVGLFFTLKNMGNLPIEFISAFLKGFEPLTIVSVLMLLVPLSVFFAAVLLSISIFAKSFKEAQNMITPLNFVVIIPAMIGMLPGVKLDALTAWIPVLNVSLATKQLMMGDADFTLLAVVYGSLVVLAVAGLFFCGYWFKKESVLFRS